MNTIGDKRMRKIVTLGILVLLAMLAMPTASAHVTMYFVEQHSSVPNGYCNNTTVEVWANVTAPDTLKGGQIAVNTNATCVNITDLTWDSSINVPGSRWHYGQTTHPCGADGYDWIMFDFASTCPSGTNTRICNLTVHCNCSTCGGYCISQLNFTEGATSGMCPIQIIDGSTTDIYPANVTLENGTVTCGTGPAEVDLNVTNIYFNPGDTRANETLRVYVNQSNDICAVVHNNGPDDVVGDFDVCFEVDGNKTDCVTVTGGLPAGEDKVVCTTWTPTCANYSVMLGYPLQSLPFTINVTADCNCTPGCCPNCPNSGSCGKINETDEANNTLSMYVPALQNPISASTGLPYGFNVTGGVVNNGYKSKHFDCSTSDPFDYKVVYRNLIGGGLVYNVTGTELTLNQGATDTRVHTITIPNGTTVKKAMLFVYWRDAWGNYKTYPSGCLANLSANMSSVCATSPDKMPIEATYHDSKGFGLYEAPIGVYIYNVTDWVCTNSGNPVDYTVNVTNIEPTGGNKTKPMGQKLVVVYEGDGDDLTHIWIYEGADHLMAADATHGSYAYHVSPAEATATISFDGTDTIPSNISSATLTAVTVYGLNPGSDLLFNGNLLKKDAWDAPSEAYPGSKVCVEEVPLQIGTDFIVGINNSMGFKDNESDGFYAHNTFLVVKERSDVLVEIEPCAAKIGSNQTTDRKTVNITLNGITNYGSGTIHLEYEPLVVEVVGVTSSADSVVDSWNTIVPGDIAISAHNATGISGDIVFAKVEFKPKGLPSQCSDLNLTVTTLYDTSYAQLPYITSNCEICIYETVNPFVTDPNADPVKILNDPGRARVPDTNLTTLRVHVTDDSDVVSVTVNLTPILGSPGNDAVAMAIESGGPKNATWHLEYVNAPHDPGVNQSVHCLYVNATDAHGNSATGACIPLTVLRRGNIVGDTTKTDMGDALYIARYTVGLEPAPDEFVAGIVPPTTWDGVNMGDALYIARWTVGLEVEP
jgi:hypothetical protein